MDEGVGEPGLVAVDGPSLLQYQRAVDLGKDERTVDADAVIDGDAGRQVLGDGLEVAAERAFPVGLDEPHVGGDPPGADYSPSATPGCRAPHLWLNHDRSTIDLFDRQLVLLTAPPGAPWRAAITAAAHRLGIPVHSHVITDPAWPRAYG